MTNRGWPGEFVNEIPDHGWYWLRADGDGKIPFELPVITDKLTSVVIQAKGMPVQRMRPNELVLPGLFTMTRQIEIARFLGAKEVVLDGYRHIDGTPYTNMSDAAFRGHVENMISVARDALSDPPEFSFQSRQYPMPAMGVVE
jgi:hypothetical protein